jgi:hypothetical protein
MFGSVLESEIVRSGTKSSLFLYFVITFLCCNGIFLLNPYFTWQNPIRCTEQHLEKFGVDSFPHGIVNGGARLLDPRCLVTVSNTLYQKHIWSWRKVFSIGSLPNCRSYN